MSIRLELEPGQAWDLRRVLDGLCECAGRHLPNGLERTMLYSLLDRIDEAMDRATPMTASAAPDATQPSTVSWVEGYRALVNAGLHGQVASALARYGLRPEDLPRTTDTELLSFRNIGKRALERIRAVFPFEEVSPRAARHAGPLVVEPHEPLIVDGEVVD